MELLIGIINNYQRLTTVLSNTSSKNCPVHVSPGAINLAEPDFFERFVTLLPVHQCSIGDVGLPVFRCFFLREAVVEKPLVLDGPVKLKKGVASPEDIPEQETSTGVEVVVYLTDESILTRIEQMMDRQVAVYPIIRVLRAPFRKRQGIKFEAGRSRIVGEPIPCFLNHLVRSVNGKKNIGIG